MSRRLLHHAWLAIAFAGVSVSCVRAFEVSNGTEASDGIPFFLNATIYRQHTTYEYLWLRVSLSSVPVVPDTGPAKFKTVGPKTTMIRDVQNSDANRQAIDSLQSLVAGYPSTTASEASTAFSAIGDAFTKLKRLPADHLDHIVAASVRRTGNYIERVAVVDYAHTYYLNGKIPPFGSNKLSATLAANGTLSAGSAEGTGGIGEAIGDVATALSGLAPIKEYLTAKWLPPKIDKKDSLSVPPAYQVELVVEPQTLAFDFTSDLESPIWGARLTPVRAQFDSGTYVVRLGEKASEKPADDAYRFTGSVQLPAVSTGADCTETPAGHCTLSPETKRRNSEELRTPTPPATEGYRSSTTRRMCALEPFRRRHHECAMETGADTSREEAVTCDATAAGTKRCVPSRD